jgi:hypothetical protein
MRPASCAASAARHRSARSFSFGWVAASGVDEVIGPFTSPYP